MEMLYWHNRMDKRVPELGMNQCVLLLLDSTFLSAPAIFQSHLILMASEAIGIDSAFTSAAPDVRLNNCYLLAFERSVILYTRHIYDLHIDGDSLGILRPDSCVQRNMLRPDFDLFIRPTTRYHVDRLLSKLDDYWDYWKKNITLRTKSELLSISFTYIEEHQRLFFGACKEKMLSFIRALITVASEEVTDFISYEKVHASLPHLFLTASILKSMNASLLQALRCLEKRSKVGNLKLLKDFLDGKEYDFIVHVISSFEKLNECLPVPRHPSIHDLLQGSKTKHTESKQMLLHFYGFLALGFRYKLEFLVKSCIFTLMTLMNLVIFEDGHLDALHPVLAYLSGYSADLFLGKLDETQAHTQSIRRSSHVVASKFQKIHTLFLSQSHPSATTHVPEISNDTSTSMHMEEETCSGKIYLNCVFENSSKPSDVEDLSDFIECKRGKNYSKWLKEREKYRKWRVQKLAVLRWEKRKKTWHSIKGMKA
uniref:DUF7812 domain-containing protein n=2 Tax=Kalanchoe fedtschenkoi TaxID=63787 RepID=A0A7N0UAY1_KALFE